MTKQENPREMSRREFLNKITTGTAALGFIWAHPAWAAAGVENPGQLSVPPEVLQKAVKILMSKGADFADVFVERATSDTYRSDDKKINTRSRVDKGVGLRAVKKGRTFYVFSESLREKDILETAGLAANASATDQLKHDIDVIALQPQKSPLKFPITPLPSGRFMMSVEEGYLIENGKITGPVKKASISGTGIEALKSIDMVGNNLVIFPNLGRCGKGQQWVPVGVGMPTARVRSMLVGGSGPSWDEKQGGAS